MHTNLEETAAALMRLLEAHDRYTVEHQRRVAQLAVAIAREIHISRDEIYDLRLAATIHDLGKIRIPAPILNKSDKLTTAEYELIKRHRIIGYDILHELDFPQPIAQSVLQHHERRDGSGYPQGLQSESIIQAAKVLAVADVFETIVSARPYHPASSIEKAIEELVQTKDNLFDANIVDACTILFREKGFEFH